jgi:hypothetical protein
MFYQNVVPVEAQRHATLKLRPVTDFRFAKDTHAVPVIGPEFGDLMRDYPIVFAMGDDGRFTPTVMVGLRQNENLFVDADGRWDASYIPFFVRRFPFVTVETGEDDAVVCIEETAAKALEAPDGMPLFVAGKPSEEMTRLAQALFAARDDAKRVEEWTKLLADAGLFKQVSASADLPNGEQVSMDGMWVVDEEKLRTLGPEQAKTWLDNGLLSLVFAHLFSLRNLEQIVDRLQKRQAA